MQQDLSILHVQLKCAAISVHITCPDKMSSNICPYYMSKYIVRQYLSILHLQLKYAAISLHVAFSFSLLSSTLIYSSTEQTFVTAEVLS